MAISVVVPCKSFAAGGSNASAKKIFADVFNRDPSFCDFVDTSAPTTIVCAYEKNAEDFGKDTVIVKLKPFAGVWQKVSEVTFEKDTDHQDLQNDFEIVQVDNKKMLYFSRGLDDEQGTAHGPRAAQFILYKLDEDKYAILSYRYENAEKGRFENTADFSETPNLLKFMESHAAKSDLIYRTADRDQDLNNVKNFARKWLRENPDAYITKNRWYSIQFSYYNDKLFDKSSKSNDIIRNKHYIIEAGFASPVFGYDKKLKKYFTIWIPEDYRTVNGSWGIRSYKAQFKGESVVTITNGYHAIEINIANKKYFLTPTD